MSKQRDLAAREAVIATCREMNALGINQGMSGNVSARSPGGFLITASGVSYDTMTPEHIVAVDMDGHHRGAWAPSSEWRMHRDIYASRAEAGAVLHVHSTYATALSCLRIELPAFHYMIAVSGGATLRCADYATFGTEALSDAMLLALEDRQACLLANHGMICFGETLDRALWLAVEIETLCRQYAIATQVGRPVVLDDDEMERVLERFASYGKGKPANDRDV